MISNLQCALLRNCLRFFVSCKTSQYVNISQLRTGSKFKVPKQPPLYSLGMTFMADEKRQRLPRIFIFFAFNPRINQTKQK